MRQVKKVIGAATATVLALAGLTVEAGVQAAPASAQGSTPYTNPSYTPSMNNWTPYVLAPSTHTVAPVSVLSATARGGSITGDPKSILGKTKSVTLTGSGAISASPLLTVDFGKEVGGEISLDVQNSTTPKPKLHVCFSESIADMALTPAQNNGESNYAPGCDTANIWNGYPGTAYTFDSDSHLLKVPTALPTTVKDTQPRGGFRYATVFLDGAGSITLNNMSLDFQASPLQTNPAAYKGWFLSSNNDLNKLWYAGAYTVQMDTWMSNTAKSWPYATNEADHSDAQVPHADPTKEVILDGAKRDRVVWQGDLAVQAPVTYLSTGDISAVDNSLSSLAAQQLPDGFVPAESLVGQHNLDEIRTYGEYVTWFVYNQYQHWLYTGDRAYLQANWAALTKATAWLESVRQQDPQGLIAFGNVGSCGHYGYSDCGHETYVNALYVRNLTEMASLGKVVGDSTATTYATRATTVGNLINAQLWDPTVGAYRTSRETPSVYPQDGNATAILTGIASPAQAKSALDYLRVNDWSTLGSLTVAPNAQNSPEASSYEPLPSGFEAEARLVGDPAEQAQAEQLLEKFWGYQLSQDPGSTFWEKVGTTGDPTLAQFTSLAHGWAAAPTVALTNEVLGVTPTSGGYQTYDVVPHPGDLTWSQGVVPTPTGSITTSWQASGHGFTLTSSAPTGTTGRLAVPTQGVPVQVRLDNTLVWDGTKAVNGSTATSDGAYVYVTGVAGGKHVLAATRLSDVPTTVAVLATPKSTATVAGGVVTVQAQLSGAAQANLTGKVTNTVPAGWTVSPASSSFDLPSKGSPVVKNYPLTVTVPTTAKPGTYPVTVTATVGKLTATGTVTITIAPPGYSFDTSTSGWVPGANASSVGIVTTIANGPGSCYSGGCLQVAASGPATTVRTTSVTPPTPIDLSAESTFHLQFNSYGGVPDATGYEAIVTLTGTSGSTLTKSFAVSPDHWNALSLSLAGWAGAGKVSKIEVGFHAVGGTFPNWGSDFQLDDVGWS